MRRSSNKDTFPLHASAIDVAGWDPASSSECCDEDSFLVDLEGMPRSDWNRSCGRVFEKSFRSDPDHEDWLNGPNIRDAWFTHLGHLIKTYKRSLVSEDKDEELKAIHRRRERKNEVRLISCIDMNHSDNGNSSTKGVLISHAKSKRIAAGPLDRLCQHWVRLG